MAVHLSRLDNNSAAVMMLNHIFEHVLSCITQLLLICGRNRVRCCNANASICAFINRTQRSGRRFGVVVSFGAAAVQTKRRYGCATRGRKSPSKPRRNPLPVPDFVPASPSLRLIPDAALRLKNFPAVSKPTCIGGHLPSVTRADDLPPGSERKV